MENVKCGVITLIYATPFEVPRILSELDGWSDIYERCFERMSWIRFSLRASNPDEIRTGWLSNRDLGVTFVELVDIPASSTFELETGYYSSGFLANEEKTIVQWNAGISLQDLVTEDSELTPMTAVSILDRRLVEGVCTALSELRTQTRNKGRKRRINVAIRAMETATAARIPTPLRSALRLQESRTPLSWIQPKKKCRQ